MGTARIHRLQGIAVAFLSAAVLASGGVGAADISLHVDINDLKSKEIEAKYTTGAGTKEIAWVTDALPMPSKDKQNSGCARIPEYMDGAICYRVCGGGLASEPVSWTYEWRRARMGHNAPWEPCNENGCRGFNPEYYATGQRGCGHFMIWRGMNYERDLRIRIKLQ